MVYPNIEAERARLGLSQAALSRELGVSPSTVKNWLTGRADIPCSKIVAMAGLFGTTTDYLLSHSKADQHTESGGEADG